MTALIRSSSQRAQTIREVRPSSERSVAEALVSPAERERDQLAAEIVRLRQVVVELERAQITAASDHSEALANSRAEGHAAGLAEGLARTRAGLTLLENGIREARGDFDLRLADMERLAAALARVAADRIVGAEAQDRGLIARTLRHAVEQLDARAVVRVLVSPGDFPDTDALADLTRSVTATLPAVEIVATPELSPGQCRFVMRLGEAEVGPAQQWERLAAELTRQAEATA